MFSSVYNYFREAIQELELVRWPTRQQAVRLSVIVLVFTLVSAALFGILDLVLKTLLHFFLSATI
jgi:preprotein translocase SecE subunit